MTREDDQDDRKTRQSELLRESPRFELATQEPLEEEPSAEELHNAEADERYWQTHASELLARRTSRRSRDELLVRLQAVAKLARAVGLAHLADARRRAEGLPFEELNAHLVALEVAVAVRSSEAYFEAAEHLREDLLARAERAVERSHGTDPSRDALLASLGVLRELAEAFEIADVDIGRLEDISTEQLRGYVADLEAAIAAEVSTRRRR